MSQHETVHRERPFQVSLGKIKFINRVVQVPDITLEINGIEFDGDPRQLLDFFQTLLEEHPAQTEGMTLDVEPGFLELLLKSRVAYTSPDNTIYPSEGFRQISRDLIGHLRHQVSSLGF